MNGRWVPWWIPLLSSLDVYIAAMSDSMALRVNTVQPCHDDVFWRCSGAPVLFAEVLEGMMPKFVERLKPLGLAIVRARTQTRI